LELAAQRHQPTAQIQYLLQLLRQVVVAAALVQPLLALELMEVLAVVVVMLHRQVVMGLQIKVTQVVQLLHQHLLLELVAAEVQVQSVATRLAQALVAMAEQASSHLLLEHP
jgi:hypothetical protein